MVQAVIFKYAVIGIFFAIVIGRAIYFRFGGDDFYDKVNELGDVEQARMKQIKKLEAELEVSRKRRQAKRVLKIERRTYYDKMVLQRIAYESFAQIYNVPTNIAFRYEKHFLEAHLVNEALEEWEIINEEYFDAAGKKISSKMGYVHKEKMRKNDSKGIKSPYTFEKDEKQYEINCGD